MQDIIPSVLHILPIDISDIGLKRRPTHEVQNSTKAYTTNQYSYQNGLGQGIERDIKLR